LSLHLEHLNPEQLAAVTLPDEHALILAGAGSGKTRVLTTRIAWLIKGGRASPSNFLAVTFTNKAAREMLTRLTAMLPVKPAGGWALSTACNRMLRAPPRRRAAAGAEILDTQDQLAVISACSSPERRRGSLSPRELQWFINGQKEEGVRARDVAMTDERTAEAEYAAYDEQRAKASSTFRAAAEVRIAEGTRSCANTTRSARYVLVDEFRTPTGCSIDG
jgi:DNA helicase-2/ATP-dependent DNA helicase PcrA